VGDHALLYAAVAEGEGADEVRDQLVALPVLHRAVAGAGLAEVVLAADGLSDDVARDEGRVVPARARGFAQGGRAARRLVVDVRVFAGFDPVHVVGHLAVALVGGDVLLRPVDGQLQVVGADAVALRVGVGEGAALQELVVGEVEAIDEDAGAEGDLLDLGEVVDGVAVKHEAAYGQERELLLGPDLRRVERVEVKLLVLVVRHHLHEHLPLGEVAALDGLVQVLRRVVEVANPVGLFLRQVALALLRAEVVLDEDGLAFGVDHLVGVDAGAAHLAVAGRDAPGAEEPGDHVRGLGREADEVEDAARVLAVGDGVGLEGVDEVGELDGVADEEDLQVVADEVPVAVLRVELDGEAARVAQVLGRVAAVDDGREADEDGRALAALLEEPGARVLRRGVGADGAVRLEVAVGAGPAGVDDALGRALAVEVRDLL